MRSLLQFESVSACARMARRVLLAIGLLGFSAPSPAETVHGAQLPDGAQKVGENRYRAQQDFEAVLKHFKGVYPPSSFPRTMIVNQPGIKAIHIANPSGKNFEGLNIYQTSEEVRIYIIPVADTKQKKKKK